MTVPTTRALWGHRARMRLWPVAAAAFAALSAASGAAAQFTCSGTACFEGAAACEAHRSAARDDGRAAPACRERGTMYCLSAYDHVNGAELTSCRTTVALCRARLLELEAANRRAAVRPYEDIGECVRLDWDRDRDGFGGAADLCPLDRGTAGGCPDSDEDGVADDEDRCPDEPGDPAARGCVAPDGDGDGVVDASDPCPTVGAAPDGCPDADGDGFFDGPLVGARRDDCLGVPGPAHGCPDFDGDGQEDIADACPRDAPAADARSWVGCPDADGDAVPDVCFDLGAAIVAPRFDGLSSPSCGVGWFADLCPSEREDGTYSGRHPEWARDGCPDSGARTR